MAISSILGTSVLVLIGALSLWLQASEEWPHSDPPSDPAPVSQLVPFRVDDVGFGGAFTPDGKWFVYPHLHKPGESHSRIMAISLSDGSLRNLGDVPLNKTNLPSPDTPPGELHNGQWLEVEAATGDLTMIFLSQGLLDGQGKYRIWDVTQKKLVEAPFDLTGASYLGPIGVGQKMVFFSRNHFNPPATLGIFDQSEKKLSWRDILLVKKEYYSLQVHLGNDVVFGSYKTKNPAGRAIDELWPDSKEIVRLPAINVNVKNTRNSAGAPLRSLTWLPRFIGPTAGTSTDLVIQHGDQVSIMTPDKNPQLRVLRALPQEGDLEPLGISVVTDASDDHIYSSWLEISMESDMDVNDYLPYQKVLSEPRSIQLHIAVDQADSIPSTPHRITFDVSPLFAVITEMARRDCETNMSKYTNRKTVLTRQPHISAIAARNGSVTLFMNFHVHYGVCGYTYILPLMVDVKSNELKYSAHCHNKFGGGIKSGPNLLFAAASPQGDASAIIWNNKLFLYRWQDHDQ